MTPTWNNCLVGLILLIVISSCGDDQKPLTVDSLTVLEEFYAYDGAEDTLMDPLIVAGEAMAPLLIDRVRSIDMPKRRYAIGALGNIGDARAIPILTILTKTEEEPGYIRCDSLQSVAQIDWHAGRALASEFVGSSADKLDVPECLSRVSMQILEFDKDEWLERTGIVRSLKDAKRRRHY